MKRIIKQGAGLAGFLLLVFAVAGIGGWLTTLGVGGWYRTINKPTWNPPDWVFGPVWTTLYAMIAVAGWQAWRRVGFSAQSSGAWGFYGAQLLFNCLWSGAFFGLHSPLMGLIDIVLLWGAIGGTIVWFLRIDKVAGWLLAPYWAWVSFAGVLNFAIWRMN